MPGRAKSPRRALGAALLALPLSALPGHAAEKVRCHLDYGGTSRIVEAAPTSSPYSVAAEAVGTFFLFRIVFRTKPADLAGIKLYTYANRDSGPALIHQASYRYPPGTAAIDGFTGRHAVYEPLRDSELQYWCELEKETE